MTETSGKSSSSQSGAGAPPQKTQSTAGGGAPKKRRRAGRWPLWLALVLALGAAGGSGFLWYQQQRLAVQHHERLTALKRQLRALDEHPSLIELKQRLLEQQNQLEKTLAEQQSRIDTLRHAFDVVRRDVHRDQRGWILAEVEYLMRMAITRLQLTYDIKGAIEALTIADQRLADLADPVLLDVRKILAGEITALKSLQQPDINGVALHLMSIANRLHLLPPAKRPASERLAEQTPGQSAPDDKSFWGHTWERIKSFIGLHRSDAPRTVGAIEAELYYVEQLLRFELEAARQAVLRLDKSAFERRLANARRILDSHYDRGHEQVIRLRAELATLQESAPFPELPDIGGSLRELRQHMAQYELSEADVKPESEQQTPDTAP